jgi:NADPH:quinone reductase-like Zn-dependent oxidoreductase
VSAVTALNALTVAGHVKAGQKVLVTGASGGVGSYAGQLARALGAEVTGVCSTAKVNLARSLGAAHVIDYTQDDFADGAHRYDLIIDIAGNPALSRLRRALAPAGTAVLTGGEDSGNVTGMGRQFRALALSPVPSPAADHAHLPPARQRPGTAHRVPRGRHGNPGHQRDLPTGPCPAGHAPTPIFVVHLVTRWTLAVCRR